MSKSSRRSLKSEKTENFAPFWESLVPEVYRKTSAKKHDFLNHQMLAVNINKQCWNQRKKNCLIVPLDFLKFFGPCSFTGDTWPDIQLLSHMDLLIFQANPGDDSEVVKSFSMNFCCQNLLFSSRKHQKPCFIQILVQNR